MPRPNSSIVKLICSVYTVAMIRMAPMSSTIASAVRKMARDRGARLPTSAITPMAKAMSVAIGMAQPSNAAGLFRLNSQKMSTGTIMPPTAAIAGRMALRKEESSPMATSRFNSSPTRKKKMAIRASLIHSSSDSSMVR